ncbi:MAG: AhpC/TSA family protein [Planctomycetes bacterium]|nr:AhpC/TSA family protein [Planctomycetota bacterium]
MLRAAGQAGLPAPMFVHPASVEDGDKFFSRRAPDARAIADPEGVLFAGLGLRRGTLRQVLGPKVLWRSFVALLKGNFVGRPTGNETQLPGAFLVRGQEIRFAHRARHAGDHPELDAILAAAGAK